MTTRGASAALSAPEPLHRHVCPVARRWGLAGPGRRRVHQWRSGGSKGEVVRPTRCAAMPDISANAGPDELPTGYVISSPTSQYEVLGKVGQGSFGTTYRCARPDGTRVAVKVVAVRAQGGWKAFDLFEREVRALRSIPACLGVPKFLDAFELALDGGGLACVLVQELVEGESLGAMMRRGWRPTEAEVRRITDCLLETTEVLASQRPPVVHRDIKPENVMVEGGKEGGRVVLVDFGAVQDAVKVGSLGTTVVGTYGFMAPEQFQGAAVPASDVYAVGGVCLYLLSGKSPDQFPQRRLAVAFEGLVEVSTLLGQVLRGLLEPLPEDRLTAREARDMLAGRQRAAGATGLAAAGNASLELGRAQGRTRKPKGSRVVLDRSPGRLTVLLPSRGMTWDAAGLSLFTATWVGFVGLWTAGALLSGGGLMALFSAPFWAAGAQLGRQTADTCFLTETLDVHRDQWTLRQKWVLRRRQAADAEDSDSDGRVVASGATADLQVALKRVPVAGEAGEGAEPIQVLVLREGVEERPFGVGYLTQVENDWIRSELDGFLASTRARLREPGDP